MNKKWSAILSIVGYFITMIIGILLSNLILNLIGGNIVDTMDVDSHNIISKLIIQVPPTVFLLYIIKKYYSWNDIGFRQLNKKRLLWMLPYIVVIVFMLSKFIKEIYININSFNNTTYIIMVLTFIGTTMAGFCEEVIFRGIILDSFKRDKAIIGAMIFSSIGFSICHITTIFMGISMIEVVSRIFYSSLLGFAFVGIVIRINNILPIIIFHVVWNFIIMVSNTLGIEVSMAAGICNIVNLFIGIISWIVVLKDIRKRKKYLFTSRYA